jgi:hypothetical protein
MQAKEFIIDHKKNRKAKTYTVKPRNPVAHAAQSVAKGSGPHTDKKKAEKQGELKHKKDKIPMEGIDKEHGSPYDRGGADAWYHRGPNPHKMIGGEEVKLSDPEEIRAYMQGYKDWDEGPSGGKQWESIEEVSPPGFKGTVKAMKKHKDIDNPWALAWSMKNKNYKSHKKADGSDK